MIITLTGDNSFGLQGELHKLTHAFVAEHGDLGLEKLDGEEADAAKIREALTSLPFLASKKLVVLRSPSKNKQFVEQFEQILADVPETTDVILVEPKPDKRLSFYKFLAKKTELRDFPELDSNALARWLADQAKQKSATLSISDAAYLIERAGANQQLLANELEKLSLYNPQITRQTIELLTEAAPQSTIFQLLEAAFGGNTKRALALYHEQRALKVEPQQIIAMLAWQLQVLTIIKAAGERSADQIAAEAKLNPYVVRKSFNLARNLSLLNLKNYVSELLKIDVASKSTSLDIDEALQNYLLNLSSGSISS